MKDKKEDKNCKCKDCKCEDCDSKDCQDCKDKDGCCC